VFPHAPRRQRFATRYHKQVSRPAREKIFSIQCGAQVSLIHAFAALKKLRIDTLSHTIFMTPLTTVLASVKSATRVDRKFNRSAVEVQ
jgi:hypothetical protein